MKIITYSDVHLEFGHNWHPPTDIDGDVMLLAGDIVSFKHYNPLKFLLKFWNKPVIYISGNHEYYNTNMDVAERVALEWISRKLPNVHYLKNSAIEIDGVHFYGGTMWTDFDGGNYQAMRCAQEYMNDYWVIRTDKTQKLTPEDTLKFHEQYVENLIKWFETDLSGPRVVLSHHAPIPGPTGLNRHGDREIEPAYTSRDMIKIIDKYQPDLWVYGHTHQPNDQTFGKTRIISNPRGYAFRHELCEGFDPYGKPVEVK